MRDANGAPVVLTGSKGLQLTINKSMFKPRVSFLDYIFGGLELTVNVAIDYTLSNGPPTDRASLHFINPMTGMNEYTQAIGAVMNIVQDYDTDQQFPCYGFGGRLPGAPDQAASHCFALNGDIYNPFVNGQKGVLNAYYKSV